MDASTDIAVRVAERAELADALRVQRAGFRRVAARFGFADDELPPIRESLADLEALHDAGVRTFLAFAPREAGERAVGTVRAHVRDDGVVEIGRLAVDDGFQRRGVATALMSALEGSYPEVRRFELFTGSEATDALALYARLGYRVFSLEDFDEWTRAWLAKDVSAPTVADAPPLH